MYIIIIMTSVVIVVQLYVLYMLFVLYMYCIYTLYMYYKYNYGSGSDARLYCRVRGQIQVKTMPKCLDVYRGTVLLCKAPPYTLPSLQ